MPRKGNQELRAAKLVQQISVASLLGCTVFIASRDCVKDVVYLTRTGKENLMMCDHWEKS